MPSRYGTRRGDPAYDRFRTGLTFADVKEMLKSHSTDPKDWKYRRRGTVLGFWHQLKRQMYEQMKDEQRRPPEVPF